MLGANTLNLKVFCQLIQTSLQVLAALHEVFDVIDAREVLVHQLKELSLLSWQWRARQQLQQVPKIITRPTSAQEKEKSFDTYPL